MNKKILVVGILVIIFSILIAATGAPNPYAYLSNIPPGGISMRPNSVSYFSVPLNASAILTGTYVSSNAIDFYVLNSTAFNKMNPANSPINGILNQATSLEGKGVFYILLNGTRGVFPAQQNSTNVNVQKPFYTINSTPILSNGTYFLLFVNKMNRSTNVSYYIVAQPITPSTTRSYLSGLSSFGIVSGILFISGFIIVFLSFLRGGKSDKEKLTESEIQNLYKKIEKREKIKSQSKRRIKRRER